MPLYDLKFGSRGRGEQLSNSPKTQPGLLAAINVDNTDGAVAKRPGSTTVSLSRSDNPTDLINNPRAISSRGDEVVIFTDSELYANQQCGLGGAATAGTATPSEIADAIAAVEVRRSPTQDIDVPLPGSVLADAVRDRLNRPDTAPDVVITPSGRTITFSTDALTWSAVEGTDTKGAALTGPNQRLPRMTSIAIPPQTKPSPANGDPLPVEEIAVVITWIGNGTLYLITLFTFKLIGPVNTLIVYSEQETLDALRGPASLSRYESHLERIVAFPATGSTLKVYEMGSPGTAQGYAVSDPPDDTKAYAIDIYVDGLVPTADGLAVTWASAADGIQFTAQLRPTSSTIVAERQHLGLLPTASIQVAIGNGAVITFILSDKWSGTGTAPDFLDRPVWDFDPAVADLKMLDLDGDELRMAFGVELVGPETGQANYRLKNATTDANLYESTVVQGLEGTTDAQWGLQNDTIYGVLVSETDGLFEVLWERTAEVVGTLLEPSVQSAAMAVSGDRLTASYYLADTDLRVRRRTDIFFTPVDSVYVVADAIGVIGSPISAAVQLEDASNTVALSLTTWLGTGDVLSIITREIGAQILFSRVDGFPDVPLFVAEIPTGISFTPFRGIFAVSYQSGSIEVYEVQPTFFVRVSPVSEIRAGGNWALRGPWTKTRVISEVVQNHGTDDVVSADAASLLNDGGDVCTLVVSHVTGVGNGVLFDVLGAHVEAHGQIDETGIRPRTSPYDSTRLAVTYVSAAGELTEATFSPGSPLIFSPTGIILLANRSWDQVGFEAAGESAVVWGAVDTFGGPSAITINVRPDISVPWTISHGTPLSNIVDASVSARVLTDGVSVEISWGVTGNTAPGFGNQAFVGVTRLNLQDQTSQLLFTRSISFPNGTAVEPVAIAVDSRDGITVEAWVELEGPVNRHVEVHDVIAASSALLNQYKRAALVSQLAPLSGSVVGSISLLGSSLTDPDTNSTFVGGKRERSGILQLSARTGEVTGRIGIGEVEDFAERQLRPPKTGLNVGPDGRLDLGWQETDLDIGTARAPTLVHYAWTPDSTAREPAVLNNIFVDAHGGYPRMYDDGGVNEHDFHSLPEITQVAIVAVAVGTGLPLGKYNLAATYESYDATGKLYRSRPTFSGPHEITVALDQAINVFTRDLTVTERSQVRMVLWRTTEQTLVGADPTYYRETEQLGVFPPISDALATSLILQDAELRTREPLDQGDTPGDVLPADPVAVTDFTATLDGRVWGVSPRQPNAMYFTVANRAGKAAHWSLAQLIQHDGPARITAATQMGSRIGLLTVLGGSGTYTPGPTSIGAGSYSNPERLNMAIGPLTHAALARIPEGTVYAAARRAPPQLLTAGWSAVPIASEIEEPYETGREVVLAIAYVQASNTLHLLGSTTASTHRLNLDSKTFGTDTFRPGLDLTVRDNGQLVILGTDGRVIFDDVAMYSAGGAGYVTSVRLPWLLTDGRSEVVGNFVECRILGTYRGAHSLTIRLRVDFDDAIVDERVISASTLADHAAAGDPYVYSMRQAYSCTSVQIEFLDDGPPNETFAIEQVIVLTEPGTGGSTPALRTLAKTHHFHSP